MPSPTNSFTVPLRASTAAHTTSKYSFSRLTSALGSSRSASCVKPPMSTNATVSSRASPATGASSGWRRISAATSFET